MLVDGVVENLGNTVVERPLIGAADVHAGLFAHGLEALEFAELGRIVGVWMRQVSGLFLGVGGFGHEDDSRGN